MALFISILTAYGIGMIPFAQLWYKKGGRGVPRYPNRRGKGLPQVMIDLGKGVTATLIGLSVAGWVGASLSAVGVVLGHTYPVFAIQQGGRGAAVAAGALFVLSPLVIAVGLVVFLISLLVTRYVTLATLFTILAVILITFLLSVQLWIMLITIALAGVVLFRDRRNLKRWRRGGEPPFRLR